MVRSKDDLEGGNISDDSISLNSTAPSEEQDQYGIDGGILAERKVDDEMQYLVKWEGYDEHRNTWEPEDNFQSGETLKRWREKKMRITRGLDKPFDVNAWEMRAQKIMEDIAARKQRRRLKKRRLGISVDSSSSLDADSSDLDAPLVPLTPKCGARMGVGYTAMSRESTEDESVTSQGQSRLLRRPWTDQERRALEAGGVREKGPYWDRVLALYGPKGTINQDLKHMNKHDLQNMAFEMKREFTKLEREPPLWLEPVVSRKLLDHASRKSTKDASAKPSVHQAGSKEGSRTSSRTTSRQTTPIKPQPKLSSRRGTARRDTSKTAAPSTPSETTGFNTSALFGPKSAKTTSKPEASDFLGPESSNTVTAHEDSETVAPKLYKGTARPDPSTSQMPPGFPRRKSTTEPAPRVQMGAPGAGPARLRSPKAKPRIHAAKSKQAAKDAKENARPRICEGLNDKKMGGIEPPKLFRNLATQNRVSKKGRDEPPPNPDNLALIDPRTAKALKMMPPPSPITSPVTQISGGAIGEIPKMMPPSSPVISEVARTAGDPAAGARMPTVDRQTAEGDENARNDGHVLLSRNALMIDKEQSIRNSGQILRSATDDLGGDAIMIDGAILPAAGNLTGTFSRSYNQNTRSFGPPSDSPIAPETSKLALQQESAASITFLRNSTRSSKMELFQRRIDLWTSCLVKGDLKVGAVNPDLYNVKLQGVDKSLQQLLLTVKIPPTTVEFELKKTCLAAEYQKFFSMVIYPVGADAWAFLDCGLPAAPEGAMLRFVVQRPVPTEYADVEVPGLSTFWTLENRKRYQQVLANASTNTNGSISKGINMVFQEMYDINYTRLISDKQPIFFLCFIPAGCESYEKDPIKRHALRLRTSEEHDLFVDFLQENGAEVYSMQNLGSYEPNGNGSWQYFVSNVKSGVVVIHDACTRIDQIPDLANIIALSQINIWKVSLEPMDEDARNPHLTRLFPHGAVILLTESLMIYRPREALRILIWFRLIKNHRDRVPGTWKLAVRVHVRPWLLDILDLCEETKKDVFGCGKQVFGDLYTNITWLLEHDYDPDGTNTCVIPDGMMCEEWDDETPNDDAPLVAPANLREMRDRKAWKDDHSRVEIDHENIKLNDDLLVQWFAEWAIVACEDFRKFQVVLGYEHGDTFEEITRRYRKRWGHIEVLTAEKCYKRQNVAPQAELDAKEAEHLRYHRGQAPEIYAKIERGRKTEREAAKISLKRVEQMYRDAGATEKQTRDGVRIHLRQTGASLKEIKETEIEMDLKNRWYESPKRGLANDSKNFEEIEAMLAEEKAEEERAERADKERLAQGRDKVMDWFIKDGGAQDNSVGEAMDVDDGAEARADAGEDAVRHRSAVEDAVARSFRLAREFPS